MTYRKIINRMVKAQKVSTAQSNSIWRAYQDTDDIQLKIVCVEAYNVHVGIWNKLQRYINSLKRVTK